MAGRATRATKQKNREKQQRFRERQKTAGKRRWAVWATDEEIEVYENVRSHMAGLLERLRMQKTVTSNAENINENQQQGG